MEDKEERERRVQEEATSLGQTRDQITELEARLTGLKEEKQQLFLTLKRVLNDDEMQRRASVVPVLQWGGGQGAPPHQGGGGLLQPAPWGSSTGRCCTPRPADRSCCSLAPPSPAASTSPGTSSHPRCLPTMAGF